MATGDRASQPRLRPKLREEGESRVTPLELFFDLVFVLAITQCTALMSHDPTWSGSPRGCWSSASSGGRGSGTPG